MKNPYDGYFDKLTSARKSFDITPSDTEQLSYAAKALRIYNPTGAAITVKVETSGGDTPTWDFPANSLTVESVMIVRVFATGTSAGIKLHGYSD